MLFEISHGSEFLSCTSNLKELLKHLPQSSVGSMKQCVALFSHYGEQSVNQSRAFIKNTPCTDALAGYLGSYTGSKKNST